MRKSIRRCGSIEMEPINVIAPLMENGLTNVWECLDSISVEGNGE